MSLSLLLEEEGRITKAKAALAVRLKHLEREASDAKRTLVTMEADSETLKQNMQELKKAPVVSMRFYQQTVQAISLRRDSVVERAGRLAQVEQMIAEIVAQHELLEEQLLQNLSKQAEYGQVYDFPTRPRR